MRRSRLEKLIFGVMCTVLVIAVVGVTTLAAPSFSMVQAATFISAALVAPKQAFETVTFLWDVKEEQTEVVPAAQTVDENDLSSGWWTEMPTKEAEPVNPSEEIPEGMGLLNEVQYPTIGEGQLYVACGAASIKNVTEVSNEEVTQEIANPPDFAVELNSSEPQVLIMHTHATESYESVEHSWYDPANTGRNTDTSQNVVAVGAEMVSVLNAAGINTIQDATLHDYPSYNGSYERSKATVESYLQKYPSIKVVLDVHRDAIEKEGTRIKPICSIGDMKSAQVMIICGADNGKMNMPNYMKNLRFAAVWQNAMESAYPGLTRPVLFDYRNYNQQLTTGSLLIEVGGHANTLEEAKYAARMAAQGLVTCLTQYAAQK
ncbi:MAG: stage II sporulation protein P [Oscillospiraceae bacterium]|nr:stage II sporulation protein P [Oscillospiraceae bacterium]